MAMELLTYNQSRQQAKMVQQEAGLNAMQEDVALISREADRKQALAQAIGAQRASASGISAFEGSPLTTINETLRVSEVQGQRDKYSTEVSKLAGKYKAKAKAGQIMGSAQLSFLKSAQDKASTAIGVKQSGGSVADIAKVLI